MEPMKVGMEGRQEELRNKKGDSPLSMELSLKL